MLWYQFLSILTSLSSSKQTYIQSIRQNKITIKGEIEGVLQYNYFQVAQDFILDGINLAAIPLTSVKPAINTSCVVSGWGVTESVSMYQNYRDIEESNTNSTDNMILICKLQRNVV